MMSSKYEFIRKPNGVTVAVSREEVQAQDEELRARKMAAKPNPLGTADQVRTASSAFAGRLRAILGLPEATTRQRQALAIAAETKAEPKEAAAILAALPEDRAAGFRHGGSLFPASAVKHDAEAQRIIAIMRSPEAEGREAAALSLALNTSLPLREVASVLSRTLQAAEKPKTPTIAERAAMEAEFGGSYEPVRRGSSEIWKAAVGKANAGMFADRGAVPSAAAAPRQGAQTE